MAKASLDYTGFDSLLRGIETMGGSIEDAAVEAMERTHAYVTDNIETAMRSQKINGRPVNWEHTGQTKDSLRKEAEVQLKSGVASVKTGFKWPSAAGYLAYGRGTPRAMKASPGLKNALSAKKMRKEVLAIQEEALEDYIAKHWKG